MTNESEVGTILWLYTNVENKPTKLSALTNFGVGTNYTDFGKNTPIKTLYQAKHNF
jgi:hypothetical protein